MEQALYLMVGAALTWGFYFIQRKVERRRTTDAIDRSQRLLELKRSLESHNVNLDELRRFESRLIGHAETAVRMADSYFTQAEEVARQNGAIEQDETVTPNDLCEHAQRGLEDIETRLQTVVRHLRGQLDGDTLPEFDDADRAWRRFRDRYARFVSHSYSGGSIRPLIHLVTMTSVTELWLHELETQLADDSL